MEFVPSASVMAVSVASLMDIVSVGTQIDIILLTVASNLGSAGKDALIMSRELRSFCSTIRNLSTTIAMLKDTHQLSQISNTVFEMTVVSQEIFTEILDLVADLRREQSSQTGSNKKLAARFMLSFGEHDSTSRFGHQSHVAPPPLEELTLQYQASLQDLDVARIATEGNDSDEYPDSQAPFDQIVDTQVAGETAALPQVDALIVNLREKQTLTARCWHTVFAYRNTSE
ncbi:hypothetical protein TruAng_000203 [Truncatella angustata]|nr:hypothetical protein TruAng_000203 [Truncatella angustata]